MPIINDSALDFLYPAPPNPKYTFRVGDEVRLVVPRRIVRAGYRKTAVDFLPEADPLVEATIQHMRADKSVDEILYHSAHFRDGLRWVFARRLAADNRLDGPERGLLTSWAKPFDCGTVVGKRNRQTGVYYPPFNYHDGDCKSGGLDQQKTVCLVQVGGYWYLAADLELIHKAK